MAAALVPGDPRQLGGFWLAGRLGSGGQGVVYEAYEASGERVAVKVLHGEFIANRVLRDSFAREVEAARRVPAFCTARVISADLSAAPPYIVSEFVAGSSLKQAVEQDGRLQPQQLHRLAIGIATALTAIHRAGVIHRDLKPANVLLGPDGPRVIDFGVARTEEMTRSATGQVKGTPAYMAPEVFRGERAGPEVDVWAWGVVVLFAALGHAPFTGAELAAVMRLVLHHDPDLDALPEPLRPVVAAALAKQPAQRPSAQQVLTALLEAQQPDGQPEVARLLQAGSRAAAAVHAPAPVAVPAPSLGETAEQVYRRLDPAAQEAVPGILLRMVVPGQDAADTLRRAHRDELADELADAQIIDRVVDAFTAAGLMVGDTGTVVIGNAALLRAWPRLRDWVQADRDGLPVQHALAEAARLWEEHGCKPGDLYQGTALERALQWAATETRRVKVNRLERRFLDAGAAQTITRERRRQLLAATFAVLLVIAMAAAAVATRQTSTAREQRDLAREQRDLAAARQAVRHSDDLASSDPVMSRLLAVAAWRLGGLAEARAAMLASMRRQQLGVLPSPDVQVLAFSPDSRTLAAGSTGLRHWEVATRRPAAVIVPDSGDVTRVAISPDGRTFATDPKGDIQLWDTASRRPVGAPLGERAKVQSMSFSPDGKTLAVTTQDHDVRLWDLTTRKIRLRLPTSPRLDFEQVAFSKDGKRLLAVAPTRYSAARAEEDSVRFWDLTERQPQGRSLVDHRADPNGSQHAAFSPDGTALATAEFDGRLRLWDVATGKALGPWITGHKDTVEAVAFSPDGTTLASAGKDRTVRLWDLRAYLPPQPGQPRLSAPRLQGSAMTGHTGTVVRLAFSPDAQTLASAAEDGTIRLWNTESVRPSRYLTDTGFFGSVKAMAISRDGSRLLATGHGRARLWDTAAGRPVGAPLTGHTGAIEAAAFHPGGQTLATAGFDGTLRFWDARTGGPIAAPLAHRSVKAVVFSPDGTTLVSAGEQPNLRFWDANTGKPIGPPVPDSVGIIQSVAFAPDGKAFATSQGQLFDTDTHRQRGNPFGGHAHLVNAVAYSPDGATLATASQDSTVRLWNVKERRLLTKPLIHAGPVLSVAFHPNGRTLATGSADPENRAIRLWDAATGRQIAVLYNHVADQPTVAFSPDGKNLWASGVEGTIAASYDVSFTTNLERRTCALAGRSMTPAEWRRLIPDTPYHRICPPP